MVLASAIRLVMIIVLILLGVKLAKVSIRLGELMMLRARIREVLLLLERGLTLGEISIPKGILVGVKLPVRLSIEHLLGSRLIGLTRLILESSDLSIGLLNGLT